ncbi:glycosyltransferase family 2 protein [Noviherbaspirillum massiliense]|uniref:glycosyltransferase family 2 protein n=1 Tax=Noviherbaspirillum massiliense TaxID=1465823 RepID=UPI0002D7D604|nr:glycosyltransferase family 2 protein [Noviherbaspirillum massiliense]
MRARKVVIGLPVYNGQKYIGAAIESHLSQSFGDFDLVISDNGSTDATPDICDDYAGKDSRVKYLRSPQNRGILWNHRRVMEAISSPDQYFRWAGGDDILEQGLLEGMVQVLDRRPEVVAVMPNTRNIDELGQIIGSMDRSLDVQSPDVFERAHKILMADYQHVVAYGLLRASTLKQMRTGPNYVGWDEIFIWELGLRGKIVHMPGPALLRRFHRGSISRVKTVKEMRKWVEPDAKGAGMNFPHWTWTYERVRALLGAPVSGRDRLRIARLLARDVRWRRVKLARDVTQAARRTLRLSDEYTF